MISGFPDWNRSTTYFDYMTPNLAIVFETRTHFRFLWYISRRTVYVVKYLVSFRALYSVKSIIVFNSTRPVNLFEVNCCELGSTAELASLLLF